MSSTRPSRVRFRARFAAVLACTLAACSSVPLPPDPPLPPPAPRPAPVPVAPPAPVLPRAAEPMPLHLPSPAVEPPSRATLGEPRSTAAAEVQALEYGRSTRGTPLQALRLAAPGASPGSRATVLLVGDAPAAADALHALARELTEGRFATALERLELVLVPQPDPDAVGLRNDHLLLRTPEAMSLARLVDRHAPLVSVELGDAAAGVSSRRASVQGVPEFVSRAADEWFLQPLSDALARARMPVERAAPPAAPDSAVEANGLKHIVSLRIDAPPNAMFAALASVLESAARRADDLGKVRRYVDEEVASQACRAERPCGYWLAADAVDTVTRLRGLGVQVDALRAPSTLLGELVQAGAPAGRTDAAIDMPAGSFHVPLRQPLGALAAAVLEPSSAQGYFAHGLLRTGQLARLRGTPEAAAAPSTSAQ